MNNNLEYLRSRIVANIKKKRDSERKLPTGPRAAGTCMERQESGQNDNSVPSNQNDDVVISHNRDFTGRGRRLDSRRGPSSLTQSRRNGQPRSSNTMAVGIASRFKSSECTGSVGNWKDGVSRREEWGQNDSRWQCNEERYAGRYGNRFESVGRIKKPQTRYRGNGSYSRSHMEGSHNMHRKYRCNMESIVKEWSPNEREVDWSKVISIDKRECSRPSKWDVTPKGFEKVPAERAKLSGVFPLPGQPQDVNRTSLDGIAERGELSRRTKILFEDHTKHNLAKCKLNRTLIITFTQSEFTGHEHVATVISNLLNRVTFDGEHKITNWRTQGEHLVLELNSDDTATLVLGLQKFLERMLGQKFIWERPEEYVVSLNSDKPINNLSLVVLMELPVDSADNMQKWLKHQGIEHDWVHCVELDDEAHSSTGTIFYLPVASTGVPKALPDGVIAIKPNDSPVVQDHASISYQSFSKIAAVQTHKPSKVVCLLNAVDALDIKNERFYKEVHDAILFGSPIVNCGPVESIKMPVPPPDYRNNFDTVPLQVGKIFIKFKDLCSAERAMLTLAGMRFADRTIICSYFSEHDFDLDLI